MKTSTTVIRKPSSSLETFEIFRWDMQRWDEKRFNFKSSRLRPFSRPRPSFVGWELNCFCVNRRKKLDSTRGSSSLPSLTFLGYSYVLLMEHNTLLPSTHLGCLLAFPMPPLSSHLRFVSLRLAMESSRLSMKSRSRCGSRRDDGNWMNKCRFDRTMCYIIYELSGRSKEKESY